MPRAKSPVELYIWFEMGATPKDLITMGYSRSSVYKHFNRFNYARLRVGKMFSEQVNKK